MWGHRGGAGAGCRGQGSACVPMLHTRVQWHTERYRGQEGAAHHGWTLSGPPPPNGGSADRIGGGRGRKGARRASAVAFRGFNRLFAKVVHKIGALQLDKITSSCM